MNKVKVGIIGCGMISEIYLSNIKTMFADTLDVVACADLFEEKAKDKAQKYHIKAITVEEMFASQEVQLIINLTIPATHAQVTKEALLHGKHVYSEKPLAIHVQDAEELVRIAKQRNLLLGCAPDTFLGGGLSKCYEVVQSGMIGTPVSMEGYMVGRGPESFHPNPESFYRTGGGPLMDMGPYYIAAMLRFMGRATKVMGVARTVNEERVCKNPVRNGDTFKSEVSTHVEAIIEFENGSTATLTTSWEMEYAYWKSGRPCLTLRGTKGYMIMADPNTYCGVTDSPMSDIGKEIYVYTDSDYCTSIPVDETYVANSRGLAVAEMARTIRTGSDYSATGENALAVLRVISGISESSKTGKVISI